MATELTPHKDCLSYSNPEEVVVSHLQWEVSPEFATSILHAKARYTFSRVDPQATDLILDTAKLDINFVSDQNGQELYYKQYAEDATKPHLGQRLVIALNEETTHVEIDYETTPASSALHWLSPSQTAGKIHPYVYTQCQAIHARSLMPCQDRPGVKITYSASVTVPSWAHCVMSAVQMYEATTPKSEKTYVWMQAVPVSSYLIALAIGELRRKDISTRCAVWSEPSVVEDAAKEFSQAEDYLKIAEDIAGLPYAWGRCDLLCLPPPFPYGGMENPCLAFISPTTLARDQSLCDVVAHSIAHSWTGNLVTSATWDHVWLNEGWSTWFKRKIMARIHNDDAILDLDAIGGYKELRETMEDQSFPEEFKKLILNIGDRDPDEVFSIIPYEKGYCLLMALEQCVGKLEFEYFFQAYVKKFARQPLTSDDFRDFFNDHFQSHDVISGFEWDKWLYGSGMPPEEPQFDRSLSIKAESLAADWLMMDREGSRLPEADIKGWTPQEIICFLDTIQTLTAENPLKVATANELQEQYALVETRNPEILFRYYQIALSTEDEKILPLVCEFITTQGRIKFTRALYRELFASTRSRKLAKAKFLENKGYYHPICDKMVSRDMLQTFAAQKEWSVEEILAQLKEYCAQIEAKLSQFVRETIPDGLDAKFSKLLPEKLSGMNPAKIVPKEFSEFAIKISNQLHDVTPAEVSELVVTMSKKFAEMVEALPHTLSGLDVEVSKIITVTMPKKLTDIEKEATKFFSETLYNKSTEMRIKMSKFLSEKWALVEGRWLMLEGRWSRMDKDEKLIFIGAGSGTALMLAGLGMILMSEDPTPPPTFRRPIHGY